MGIKYDTLFPFRELRDHQSLKWSYIHSPGGLLVNNGRSCRRYPGTYVGENHSWIDSVFGFTTLKWSLNFFPFSSKLLSGSVFNLCLCFSALRNSQYLSEIKGWEINVLKKYIVINLLGYLLIFRIISISVNEKDLGLIVPSQYLFSPQT